MSIINQTQTYKYTIGAGTDEQSFSLKSMRYPITEILFVMRRDDSENENDYFNYSNKTFANAANKINPIKTVRLMFDGRDRIKTTSSFNFTQLEPSKVHTNTPVNTFIHVYSFALEPEKIEQPNGLCNFSEIQEAVLHLSFNSPTVESTLFIFAVNYNVLISSGGGGNLLHHLSKAAPTVFPDAKC